MQKRKILAVSFLAASIAMTGCATKQETGTMLGAGIGGIACNLIAKNSGDIGRLVATAGCAAIGGYLGGKIGKSLDERDRVALAATTQQALEAKGPGTYNWKSEHSGATAQIKVGETFTTTEQVSVKRKASIQPVASMEKLNAPYLTLKGSNVRSAPTTSSEKVGSLPAMTEFTAMGKTGDWIMVGRRGVAVGYIYANLVQSKALYEKELNQAQVAAIKSQEPSPAPETEPAARTASVAVPVSAPVKEKVVVPVAVPKLLAMPLVKLDEATAEAMPEMGSMTTEAPVVENTVAEVETCRDMESSVRDAQGKVETSKTTSCKKPELDMWADA